LQSSEWIKFANGNRVTESSNLSCLWKVKTSIGGLSSKGGFKEHLAIVCGLAKALNVVKHHGHDYEHAVLADESFCRSLWGKSDGIPWIGGDGDLNCNVARSSFDVIIDCFAIVLASDLNEAVVVLESRRKGVNTLKR